MKRQPEALPCFSVSLSAGSGSPFQTGPDQEKELKTGDGVAIFDYLLKDLLKPHPTAAPRSEGNPMATPMLQDISSLLPLGLLGRLGLATLLGGAIGLERELSEKPAGLRTNILICLGAAIFAELSVHFTLWGSAGTPADPTRIASQIVSGIGFLGAGAIIQSRANVTGLTTAATIWVVAAIGMAVGSGATAQAVWGTGLILLVLVGLGVLERRIDVGWTGLKIHLRLPDQGGEMERVLRIIEEKGLRVTVEEVQREPEEGVRKVRVRSRVARSRIQTLSDDLMAIPEVGGLFPD